jgi:N-acetylmuramoyl-L-alanine amidase
LPRSTVALLLGLTFVTSVPIWPAAQGPTGSYRVLSREGTRQLPFSTLNNQDVVALDEVARLFGVTLREDQLAGGVTLTAGTRTIIVTAAQPVVSVAGRLVSLSAPPVRQGGRWLVPIDFLQRAMGPALDTRMEVRRPSRLVLVGDIRAPRIVSRVEAGPNGTTVTFDATPSTAARVVVEAGRLIAAYEADALDLQLPSVPPQDFLQAVQPGDAPGSIRLTTGPKFAVHRATTSQPEPGASRLVIELLPAGADAPATAPVPPMPLPADLPPLPLPMPAPGVRTVVIDPGHGGDEVGARGANGAEEKAVALAIARRLRTLIESRLGLRVYLTRDDDRLLTLDERSAYANSQKADVFISIHANAALRPAIRGAEVFYLSADHASRDLLQQGEGQGAILPTIGGGARAIDLIRWDSAQTRYLEQSGTLANLIEQALRARVEMSPRAVQQAPFRVLVGANMPAVLVEVGYLTNGEQEQALSSGLYQDRIAQSLFDGIAQFRALTERALGLTPPAPPAPPRPPK